MTSADILLTIDLAVGTTLLTALAMIVVPNLDRIRDLRRALARRRLRGVRSRRRMETSVSGL
jgi:hypothetical protein